MSDLYSIKHVSVSEIANCPHHVHLMPRNYTFIMKLANEWPYAQRARHLKLVLS